MSGMTILFKEIAAQYSNHAQDLLRRRRNGKFWFLGFVYGVLMIGGAGAGAFYAGGENSPLFAYGLGASMLIFAGGALFLRINLKRSERMLDQSLDIIAAARSMAYENNVPKPEFDELTARYRALKNERARRLFEAPKKRL